jgi:hypothetical protein
MLAQEIVDLRRLADVVKARRAVGAGPLGIRFRERVEAVKVVATEHDLSNVRVFGSVARGDDREGVTSICWPMSPPGWAYWD